MHRREMAKDIEMIEECVFSPAAANIEESNGQFNGCGENCSCVNAGSKVVCSCLRSNKRIERKSVLRHFECHSNCSCSSELLAGKCRNRESQKIQISIQVFDTNTEKGYGVRASQFIPRYSFVIEYIGEVITSDEANSRRRVRNGNDGNYILTVREKSNRNMYYETNIDATEIGNLSRYINHSCSPNLSVQLVRRASIYTPHVCFVSNRDIKVGEELTFSYGHTNKIEGIKCQCNSSNCSGYLPFDPCAP